jgi:hypothetical protein
LCKLSLFPFLGQPTHAIEQGSTHLTIWF